MDKKRAVKVANMLVNEYTTAMHDRIDPCGSWTGNPESPLEVPVQDADDL